MKPKINSGIFLFVVLFITAGCVSKWSEEVKDGYNLVHNKGAQTLGYAPESGVSLIMKNGFAFKDLNRNGKLDVYEDWRKPVDERAADLAAQMSVEQIAGLMLYSGHQSIPAGSRRGFGGGTYNGKPLDDSDAHPGDLTDQQIKFLTEDNLRHVLITTVQSPGIAAQWNNNMQALVEGLGLGIPGNTSSDPRHGSDSYAEYNAGAGGDISRWPGTLGLAATFDPELMQQFGDIASREYRALGITTALSPQIDLATEPRWSRFDGTMGEDPGLAADMARAYVDGFQTSAGEGHISGGWGYNSVNAMVKHWPGGGPEEGGRDGHFGYGAYAVYPGNRLQDHLKPFTEGAFKLDGPTGMASAVMPYYTISWNMDTVYGENVGNAFSKYIIEDLLRGKFGYDGVLCTDWGVTGDVANVYEFRGKSWGVEELSVAERHYKALMAGMDQFGGNNDMGPVLEAYQMGVEEHGEAFMRRRFETSAVRLLRNIFRTGLFENPYLDVAETEEMVGNPEFMKAGYEAQLSSVVMLKNHNNVLPLQKRLKVYVPQKFIPAATNWFGQKTPERWEDAASRKMVEKYFEWVESPDVADVALVFMDSPQGGTGYSLEDLEKGGNGYVPINLQYETYVATHAREVSLAGGSPFEDFTNRSYNGKTGTTANRYDLQMVNDTKAKMGAKPVITIIDVSNPMVMAEFEKKTDAILVHFSVSDQALLDIVTGAFEPSALLPFQMPASMRTVDEQFEDTPRDMEPYTDSDGNTYEFAFGLNWQGVIDDERVEKYR
jgi:beta-glucosidase